LAKEKSDSTVTEREDSRVKCEGARSGGCGKYERVRDRKLEILRATMLKRQKTPPS
jgi:hypothetical protein